MSLLQFGLPGGPELLIILLLPFLFGVPIALVVLLLTQRSDDDGDDDGDGDRIQRLERRVERLERKLDEDR